uniref:Uncharacterized protein n=1 Tax=Panagrolaimus sp. PS1159 TaxID=55785 RepID=A0AC35FHG7_9BILA
MKNGGAAPVRSASKEKKRSSPPKVHGRFDGLVVIITGSSSGIGQATAIQFAKEGASVTLHGQSTERLEETKKQIIAAGISKSKVLIISGPIQDESIQDKLIDETAKHFGKLDVLVNNAGCPTKPGIDQNSLETFDFVFEVNVRAVYRLIQIAVPHLEKTKGSIVNLSSGLSQKPSPLMIPYSITKAAINHLTRNFASALASKGIRVNAVAPGIVSTEFHDRSGMGGNHVLDVAKNIVPLNRAGRPEEQAQLILNIAAPDNSYMTGSIIFNDGGLIL